MATIFVLGGIFSKFETILISLFCAFVQRAEISDWRFIFLGKVKTVFLGFGPRALAPPTQSGERREPALALPVPFWRQGLAPPPRTSLLVFAEPWWALRLTK